MRIALLAFLLVPAAQDDQAALLKTFRDEFVEIEPGTFSMGSAAEKSSQPVHDVRIPRKFHIARYEVPQNLWESVMGSNPSRWKGRRNSVEMVSFDDSVEFCRKITMLLREAKLIKQGQDVRLPSEAEWEYAVRAGTKTVYSFGDDPKQLGDYAWFHGNAAGNDPPVGAKKPNPWKLYDVHGYLWEWCVDPWHETYEGAPDNGGAWDGDPRKHVLRGGSWKDNADALTSAHRIGAASDLKDDAVGLRCVLIEVSR